MCCTEITQSDNLYIDGGVLASRSISTATTQTTSQLRSQGINLKEGRLSVTTDKVAPSRQEYIAQTQRAFEQGAKTMALHPEAFKMGGRSREPSDEGIAGGSASSVDAG